MQYHEIGLGKQADGRQHTSKVPQCSGLIVIRIYYCRRYGYMPALRSHRQHIKSDFAHWYRRQMLFILAASTYRHFYKYLSSRCRRFRVIMSLNKIKKL